MKNIKVKALEWMSYSAYAYRGSYQIFYSHTTKTWVAQLASTWGATIWERRNLESEDQAKGVCYDHHSDSIKLLLSYDHE